VKKRKLGNCGLEVSELGFGVAGRSPTRITLENYGIKIPEA
jgi:aryl-alcohol dehydrogenase-like predicted oxidoreductase